MESEPVSTSAAISAAIVAVVNVLAIALDWKNDVVAAVNLAVGAVVLALSMIARSKVTPVADPTLTPGQIQKAQSKL